MTLRIFDTRPARKSKKKWMIIVMVFTDESSWCRCTTRVSKKGKLDSGKKSRCYLPWHKLHIYALVLEAARLICEFVTDDQVHDLVLEMHIQNKLHRRNP